ncbi:nucleotide sugar dehydrogenase [Candidatus Nitrosotenuis uzonensis]|uniref:UDP-N-acetyl-D-mannosamine dehydrogenase n=1 Tax=Candidatus Nitrosotenuis uzonensis TaxID=1407055 RepID=V6AV48_9ARCH|nr:nucleotide sugar dehydrogenase [Candidatus Nitrosotenuis uzonensis]CDI06460.1 UDP-glucose/GDP-mannose dehydrogenase [Candidatus Nitrosotenuis uzonensis]
MAESLSNLVKNHKVTLSVFGLGNVGGPIAAAWLRAGAKVIGVDISKTLLEAIKNGTSHKKEPFLSETFSKAIKDGNFSVTDDGINASKNSDIKIIAVPVGLKNKKIELKSLIAATTTISKGLKKGDAVIVCPSLPPGTTQIRVLKILEKNSKLKGERDFYLIYNPERIFEGRALQDIEENYPAIVSGLGPKSLDFADELLKIISKKSTLRMSTIANAEAEKLFEGVYRDVNIALANELADYCERIGVDYWEARKGANSQPFCHLHYPGTGVGGLCIPVYPRFIIESSKKIGKHVKLVEYSRQTNDYMPKKCVKDAITLMRNNRVKLKGSKIAVLGLGFRGEVTDTRLSPTYTVVKELLKQGCRVTVHDPFIEKDPLLPKKVVLTRILEDATKDASLIFISSDHKMYSSLSDDSFKNAKKPILVFDGRNILSKDNFKNASILTIGQRV